MTPVTDEDTVDHDSLTDDVGAEPESDGPADLDERGAMDEPGVNDEASDHHERSALGEPAAHFAAADEPLDAERESRPAAEVASADVEDAAPADPVTRTTDARLARLHLRGGLLTLARAELEQMAGTGMLDGEALADLAEARWRSGDLEGASEAAQAHLATGGQEPLAHLIVAEALDRHGHLIDARAQSAQVIARLGPGIDRLFAGEPRSTAWPAGDGSQMFTDANDLGRRGLLVGGADAVDPELASWETAAPPEPLPDRRSPVTSQTGAFAVRVGVDAWTRAAGSAPAAPLGAAAPLGPPSSMHQLLDAGHAAGLELEAVEDQVKLGELDGVIDRLGLLLRMDRALAPVILSLADRVVAASPDNADRLSSLHMLRGDIYRGLGRDVEATAAYQEAMRAVSSRAPLEEPT